MLTNEVGNMASIIAKDIKIRKLAHNFQIRVACKPILFLQLQLEILLIISCLMLTFKFFITASVKTRALRRFKELKELNKKISFNEVLKSIKKRDKSDYNRAVSPLKRTKDQYLISSENESKRSCFLKIKKIIDRKIKA